MTDAASQLSEHATYCKPDDPKRPSLVGLPDASTFQICPDDGSAVTDDVTDAYPDGWYVRIMFDELLDPSVEELVDIDADTQSGTIANTHPVELQCESVTGSGLVDVPYDGYYSPAGNNVTWPLGPSLVIKPNDPGLVATASNCQVTINDSVTDKEGNPVPQDQRGPFKFKIAPIQAIAIDPADDPDGESPVDANTIWYENAFVQFNTAVDPTSLCTDADDDGNCDGAPIFEIKDVEHPTEGPGYCDDFATTCGTKADCPTGATLCGKGLCSDDATICNTDADCATGDACNTTYAYSYDATFTQYGFGPKWPVQVERSYTFGFVDGAKVKDRCGKETTLTSVVGDNTLVHFKTNPFTFNKANIASGETSAPTKKLLLSFSNVLRGGETAGASVVTGGAIAATDFTLTPAPVDAAGTALTNTQIAVSDPGLSGQAFFRGIFKTDTEYTFTLKAGAKIKDWYGVEYTNDEAMEIKWKTSPKITASFSPADATVIESDGSDIDTVTIKFNQSIDLTTFTAADFTLTNEAGVAVAGLSAVPGEVTPNATCGTFATGCELTLVGTFAPGKYKFTMKAGAEVADIYGAKYTQAADKVINFEVEAATPSTPSTCL